MYQFIKMRIYVWSSSTLKLKSEIYMSEVSSATAWMGIFVGLLVVSAFAAEGKYFPYVSTLCLAIVMPAGFSCILIVPGETRNSMSDQKGNHDS